MAAIGPARVQQRGAALLMAMVIVTLVATIASTMVWQQWRAVQVEAAERARSQAHWVLVGALDWSRLILREDANTKTDGQLVDHLGEPWAVELAEARLSSFLAADKNNTDDGPEAFLSGKIEDATARYNLAVLLIQHERFAEAIPELRAQAAVLADLDTGQVLFNLAGNERRPIASLTKIMTALLVLVGILQILDLLDELNASSTTLVLVTGPIWARPIWCAGCRPLALKHRTRHRPAHCRSGSTIGAPRRSRPIRVFPTTAWSATCRSAISGGRSTVRRSIAKKTASSAAALARRRSLRGLNRHHHRS